MNERFFEQALSVLYNNDCKPGDIIDAYNQRVLRGGGISYNNDTARGVQNGDTGDKRSAEDI